MQLIFTDDDLRRMPANLRADLLAFIAGEDASTSDFQFMTYEGHENVVVLDTQGVEQLVENSGNNWGRIFEHGELEDISSAIDRRRKRVAEYRNNSRSSVDLEEEITDEERDYSDLQMYASKITNTKDILPVLALFLFSQIGIEKKHLNAVDLANDLGLETSQRVGPYLGSISSAVKRMTKNPDAALWVMKNGNYHVPQETREALHKKFHPILPGISELLKRLKSGDPI